MTPDTRDALSTAGATLAVIAVLYALALLAPEWPPVDLEAAYPVSYRACLERMECR